MITKVSLEEKFAKFDEHWSPKIVAELNGQYAKVAKFLGAFDWHRHEKEDELFFVIRGKLDIQLRDGLVTLSAGEMCVVPKGVEHRPVAESESCVLLLEPKSTLNTGNTETSKTVRDLEWV